jgi:hypothetical protein
MIIFGSRGSSLGSFKVPYSKCDYCEEGNSQEISVFGKYAHVFWIPLFPIGKTAFSECTHCKRTLERSEFTPDLERLYQENKKQAKRPWWHWLGLGFIGTLFLLGIVADLTTEEDPRKAMLQADESLMVSNPSMESDSISFKIKQIFDVFANDEIKPEDFKYLSKVEEDKALILVQIPKLRKVEKEARSEALEMVEMITDTQKDLEGKELFIGVKGLVSMILIKTPTYEDNSRLALTSELYEFYGPKPSTEEE